MRHLPHQLVEAFRSTLEEVADADLLVHVVDGSDADPVGQIDAVREVLTEVVAEHDARRRPSCWSSTRSTRPAAALARLRRALPDAVFVSAHTGEGLDRLRSRMGELVEPTDTTVDVTIPLGPRRPR